MNAFGAACALGWGLSAGVLLVSYGVIAAYTSSPWLWSVIVHESGDRTLLQTILYYEHAARELPLDVVLGASVAAAARFVLPAPSRSGRRSRRAAAFGVALAAAAAVIVAGTLRAGGTAMLYENLFQFPTRPGEPLVWGGHWRYHLLSHLGLMLCSFGLAGAVMLGAGRSRGYRSGLRVFWVTLGVFLVLTILFVPKAESFTDPVFLGHQAREAFTHALVTVPMAFAACLLLGREHWRTARPGTVQVAVAWAIGAVGAAFGVFLVAGALATSAASQGQSDSLAVLIFPHFFEHTFSYVVATFAACLVFEAVPPEAFD